MVVTSPQTEAEFRRYYDFRWRMLRKPWNQPRGSERDAHEIDATHYMIIDESHQVVAVGRLHQTEPGVGQIRYMAVDPDYQGQGLGKRILESLEKAAREQGVQTLFLHAREPVVGFYQRQGYQLIEPSHTLYDSIAHFYMRKQLELI